MKQRIFVSRGVGSTGYELDILSVHRVDNQLISIAKLTTKNCGGDAMCTMTDDVIVETGAPEMLPVVHYLIIPDQYTYEYAVSREEEGAPSEGRDTPFKLVPSAEGLESAVANGNVIYKKRKDSMMALRLHRFDAMRNTMRPAINADKKPFEAEKMQAIVNLFPVMDDGLLKLVIESIAAENTKVYYHRWNDLLSHAVYKLTGQFQNCLPALFYEQTDDHLTFEALSAGKLTKYRTHAIEFSLPQDKPEMLLFLMTIFDEAVRQSKIEDFHCPYGITQVSQQSILSCFDAIYISNMRSRETYDKKLMIENQMPRTIEDFLNLKGTVHNPENVSTPLLEKIGALLNKSTYPKVNGLLSYLRHYGSYQTALDYKNNFAEMLGIDLKVLFGEGELANKLAIITALEKRLLSTNRVDNLTIFIAALAEYGKQKLVEKAFGKPAVDGGQYNERYTEIQLFEHADFCLRDDQRMSIKLKNNPAYQTFYAPGCPNHAVMAEECKLLASTLGLEFSPETDFHQELIFTPDSSMQLQALGVSINPVNLALQASKRQRISTFSAPSPCSNNAESSAPELRMRS